jgi:hypothetical protein
MQSDWTEDKRKEHWYLGTDYMPKARRPINCRGCCISVYEEPDHFACVSIGDFDQTGYGAHPLVFVNATGFYCYPRPFGRRAIP